MRHEWRLKHLDGRMSSSFLSVCNALTELLCFHVSDVWNILPDEMRDVRCFVLNELLSKLTAMLFLTNRMTVINACQCML